MSLNDLIIRISKKNRKRYVLLRISIAFAVSTIGAYGILLFSPTITDILMTDGSTYLISLGMFAITMVGIIVFLFYANAIYIQSQMKDTGVFLSLGLNPKSVILIQNKQLDRVFFSGGLIGLFASIPVSVFLWILLGNFLSIHENKFTIGYTGVLIAIVLWTFVWVLLRLKNTIYLSRMDIIKILHSSSAGESIKASNPVFGVLGLIAIPTGLILFNITAVLDKWKTFSIIFLGISLMGIYLLTVQITSMAQIVKKYFKTNYKKNLLFYNLVKQKGNQYTLALFVSSLLIALTVFSLCFNGSSFLELYYQIEEDPYDYAVLVPDSNNAALNKQTLQTMANNYDINITEWKTLSFLLLGREHQYNETDKNEWSSELVTSLTDFNKLSGLDITIPDDSYLFFQDSDDASFRTCSEEYGKFYNPTLKKDFRLKKIKLLSAENYVNNSAHIDSFAIVNDKTFQEISASLEPSYKLMYYLYNSNTVQNSREYQFDILQKTIEVNHGQIFDNYRDFSIKDKLPEYNKVLLPYVGNELYAARWWDFYPYAKQTQLDIQVEAGAVYLLLIFFISIVSFVSATMIIGLKIAGTISQDQDSYRKVVYLGLKKSELKKIIRKQIGLIYFFPTICGCITALFMTNRFIAVSSLTHTTEITWVAAGLSLIVFLIQLIVFMFLQKRLVTTSSYAVFESR